MLNAIEKDSHETKGLPGLKSIRSALDLEVTAIARMIGITRVALDRIQACAANCSVTVLRKLSDTLCCTPNDLLGTPTPERLAEIRVAYLERQLEEAKAS